MDVKKLLADVTALPGVSGHEAQVSAYFAEQFRPLVDEVTVDAMYSVIAHKKGNGPKIMLCAHLDEIALMVTHIEDDGSLRLGNVGGTRAFSLRAACGCMGARSCSAPSVRCRRT